MPERGLAFVKLVGFVERNTFIASPKIFDDSVLCPDDSNLDKNDFFLAMILVPVNRVIAMLAMPTIEKPDHKPCT